MGVCRYRSNFRPFYESVFSHKLIETGEIDIAKINAARRG
jgi:hypothetical protein